MTSLSLEAACALLITQQEEIARLNERLFDYETKFLNLKLALKPFASLLNDEGDYIVASPSLSDLRAARAAMSKQEN